MHDLQRGRHAKAVKAIQEWSECLHVLTLLMHALQWDGKGQCGPEWGVEPV